MAVSEVELTKAQRERLHRIFAKLVRWAERTLGKQAEDMFVSPRDGDGVYMGDEWHRYIEVALKRGLSIRIIITAWREH